MEEFAQWLVTAVQDIGYPGIFIAMFFGNALVPVPVEFIMIPSGYLVQQGQMHFVTLVFVALTGDICGSLFSYYIAYHFGRRVLVAFGKHLFFGPDKLEMLDKFFASHGEISILTGRLTPGLRHFMAFPAGLSHMNVRRFALYTGVGGGLWSGVLICVGYMIGGNKEMVKHYMPYIEAVVITGLAIVIFLYVRRHRKQQKPEATHGNS